MNMELRQLLFRGVSLVLTLVMVCAAAGRSAAQSGFGDDLSVFPSISLGELGTAPSEPAEMQAGYVPGAAGTATLTVTATMQPDWHVYSITQAAGGPTPTKITVTGPAGVKLAGEFKADAAPKKSTHEAWPGLTIEEHYNKVTWSAPVTFPVDFSGAIEVTVTALVCKTDGSCIPFNEKLQAKPAGRSNATAGVEQTAGTPAAQVATFRNDKSVVQWSGEVAPATAAPGSYATLRLTAKPDATYHVYAAAVDDTASRTNFVIAEKSGLKLGTPQPQSKVIVKTLLPTQPPVHYHEGEVTWAIPIEIGANVAAGIKQISGMLAYQACTDTSCLQPRAVKFTAEVEVSPAAGGAKAVRGVQFETASYAAVMDAAAETKWVDPVTAPAQDAATESDDRSGAVSTDVGQEPPAAVQSSAPPAVSFSLLTILGMGLVGGLILNLMPCVLPVVGLKIMSFASQAGNDRGKVLALNVAYTLGILIVFWALAALAIVSTYSWGREFLGIEGQMSWGQQFQFFGFRYGVILLVFAMALSFLGVWEIPLPGFVGGKSTQELQRQEGFSGAFFKGIFTTLLATPCSGPLLGTVFAYTLGESAWVILAIFSSIGLGMALPYLLIAVFPRLIVFLPKPGAWMDTFKQLLGFLLLGTVAFIFSFFPDEDLVLVFGSLIGVWFGCWIIGRVPNWETLPKRLAAWSGGVGAAAAACFLVFWATAPGPVMMAWEPYNEARLQQLQREGRTVMVDFTAKWCVNCIVNYNVAINTEQTGRLVRELNAVPMLADWTDHDEAIQAKLQELDSNSIPVLAIFPGSDPANPIILRDLVSQGEVLTALRQAGPSITPASANVAALESHDRNR